MEAGIGYPAAADAQDYKYFEITNPENVPLRVKLQFGSGGIIDTRAIFAGIVNVQNKVPDVVNSDFPVFCPDAATTQIAAQNTRRAHIQIVNLGNDTVFLGNSPTATFNYGTPLFANGVATWPTTAALYIRNDTGAPVNISVTELEITP